MRRGTPPLTVSDRAERTGNQLEWRIALSELDYGPEEYDAVRRVLDSRWLSMGPEVAAFEREFAAASGAAHALAVSNATAALHLALLALEVGPGDEVIQPALNFVAAANMTLAVGGTPVFADIASLHEPTIDPEHVSHLLSPRTKAVIVMHYGGYPGRMAPIVSACAARGIPVIEDACHAPLVTYEDPGRQPPHGRTVGTLGHVACFSFFGNKNLATGEGGMITTDDEAIAARLRALRSHGMTTLTWERHRGHASSYDVARPGYNCRLDELRAALGRVQLQRLPSGNARRRDCVRRYHRQLVDSPVTLPFAGWDRDFGGHLMPVLAANADHRARIASALRDERIQSSLHYPAIPTFAAYRSYAGTAWPLSHDFADRVVTLPLHARLSDSDVDAVATVVKRVEA